MNDFIKTFKYNKYYWKGNIEVTNTHKSSRNASWLELFVDLVFVAGFSLLVHGLIETRDLFGLIITILYFLLIWSSWYSTTTYSDLFEQRGILHRSIMFANLVSSSFILIPYSSNYEEYLNNESLFIGFTIALISSRIIMFLTWHNAYKNSYNKFLKLYLKGKYLSFLTSIFLAIIAIFLINITPLFLTFIVFLICINEIILPMLNKDSKINPNNKKFFNTEHLVERFGLFTMLIIGESILSIINNIQNTKFNIMDIVILFLFFLFIFLTWFLYYEIIMNKGIKNPNNWILMHIILHFSFLLIAVGINLNLHDMSHGFNNFLLYSLIVYFIALTLLKSTLDVKQTLHYAHYNLDESKIQKRMTIITFISIIYLIMLLILNFNSIILVIILINLLLVLNIIIYLYNYIKLMSDIMW